LAHGRRIIWEGERGGDVARPGTYNSYWGKKSDHKERKDRWFSLCLLKPPFIFFMKGSVAFVLRRKGKKKTQGQEGGKPIFAIN